MFFLTGEAVGGALAPMQQGAQPVGDIVGVWQQYRWGDENFMFFNGPMHDVLQSCPELKSLFYYSSPLWILSGN